jgi:hypothetical protein
MRHAPLGLKGRTSCRQCCEQPATTTRVDEARCRLFIDGLRVHGALGSNARTTGWFGDERHAAEKSMENRGVRRRFAARRSLVGT